MSQGAFYLIRTREEWSRHYRGLMEHCSSLLNGGSIWIKPRTRR